MNAVLLIVGGSCVGISCRGPAIWYSFLLFLLDLLGKLCNSFLIRYCGSIRHPFHSISIIPTLCSRSQKCQHPLPNFRHLHRPTSWYIFSIFILYYPQISRRLPVEVCNCVCFRSTPLQITSVVSPNILHFIILRKLGGLCDSIQLKLLKLVVSLGKVPLKWTGNYK
jgi:hypothetical protein